MMVNEAKWLGNVLDSYQAKELSPLVNIGSSTEAFRKEEQPHIDAYVFKPLRERGVEIVHSDIKEGKGVDVSCDIFDDESLKALIAVKPKALICSHMFEHVEDRDKLVKQLLRVLPEGGLFFISGPNSYHEHNDPIDTMFRPTPEELAELFKGQEIIDMALIEDCTYWTKVRQRPLTIFFRHFVRFFIPFVSWKKWKRSMKKLYWLFHRYKVAAIIGRKVTA